MKNAFSMKFLIPLLFFGSFAFGQKATIVKYDAFEKVLQSTSNQIQVINFWATWCAPCVKELPMFEKLNSEKRPDIKVTLVTLDFADKVDKVDLFLSRKQITSDVLLLDEVDYNSWIDKVEKSWTGAIPATLVINSKTGKRKFIEKELKEGDLENLINAVR